MWKKDEAVRPPSAPGPAPSVPQSTHDAVAVRPSSSGKDHAHIGKSVVVKGALSASEDMTIDGLVEGTIELKQNVLTIAPNGKITAKIVAKAVVVLGHVHGNITAIEKIDIKDSGSVDGDLVAPRVAISEGAHFRGSIDMQRGGEKAEAKASEPKSQAPAEPTPPSTGAPVR
ncbi:MAG TPA: polymer-forming cytoskeletal protein [Vicinamibacterales bacterium]|nr:polymer-forming cytoskeletal protein [Vicinamibacterales bacterium]